MQEDQKRNGQLTLWGQRHSMGWVFNFILLICVAPFIPRAAAQGSKEATILEIQNIVQTSAGPRNPWDKAKVKETLKIGERIRTRQKSLALLRLGNLFTARLNQFTTIRLIAETAGDDNPRLDLMQGSGFLFSREEAGKIRLTTPTTAGALLGTQVLVEVLVDGTSKFQVLEGRVDLKNQFGDLVVKAGEAARVSPGEAPKMTAVIEAKNLLQWALYYPAVISPGEMSSELASHKNLRTSFEFYRSGDPLGAFENLPDQMPDSREGVIYNAAVLLAVGRVDETEQLLKNLPRSDSHRRSLHRIIDAVKFREVEAWEIDTLTSASECLAESYYRQSRGDLAGALTSAKRATTLAPKNGYGHTRLAELEFSHSQTKLARKALAEGLELAPRNAHAHALMGFILSADHEVKAARKSFENAISLDGSLGNGWLGLGLIMIKQGDLSGGRAALQTAATVEPTLSIFHSYLAKALSLDDRPDKARKDLMLAKALDQNDPTPFLYSALEWQKRYHVNQAVADLQRSIELNDNRSVYRSQFLLDQDRAVRSANLASIYQNAGLEGLAVREATRAVEQDYTNPSAHLFLANSFDALRDPNRVALRYETPWFNELLLANLLAPVGGGPLSQFVSQQEYSRLLESDGLGASVDTEWRSNGESRSNASIFGTSGRVSFGIDASFREDPGERSFADSQLAEVYAQLKWQATPDDIIYLLGKWAGQESGDNLQNYENLPNSPGLEFEENQEPGLLLGGWNHRWAPGSHTLALAGRLSARQTLLDPESRQLLIKRNDAGLRPGFLLPGTSGPDGFTNPALASSVSLGVGGALQFSDSFLNEIAPFLGRGDVESVGSAPFEFATTREFEIHSFELQHLLQTEKNLLILGGRYQSGEFDATSNLSLIRPNFSGGFSTPAAEQKINSDFERLSLYAYDYFKLTPELTVMGGLSWDRVEHPENFRNPPLSERNQVDEKFAGKLAFTYAPSKAFAARGMFSEGIGGVTFDESVRLEPVQLAGFNQAYRTVISESLVGSVEAPDYRIAGLSFEGALPNQAWWSAAVGLIEQSVDRQIGAFTGYESNLFISSPAYFPGETGQSLDYREATFSLSYDQLIGRQFSLGARYQLVHSTLKTEYPDLPEVLFANQSSTDRATLQSINLHATWNSPSGLFARLEGDWYHQALDFESPGLPSGAENSSSDFWQVNAHLGYRFNEGQSEIRLGVLNLTDQDYQLSPLNPYSDLVRERTGYIGCRFSF